MKPKRPAPDIDITMASPRAERAFGLRYAREWRVRMKPHFDALFGEAG